MYQEAGRILDSAGRVDEAIELLKEGATKVQPEYNLYALYHEAGRILDSAGRVDEAIELLQDGTAKLPAASHRAALESMIASMSRVGDGAEVPIGEG
ncbi:MAG: hypothetical protein GY926_18645 [bacterium]|nr:hypothetical protein [bacterium]